MSDCKPNWFGGKGAHKFEARSDYKPPSNSAAVNQTFWGPLIQSAELLRALGTETYVHDICTRCGETIERSKP